MAIIKDMAKPVANVKSQVEKLTASFRKGRFTPTPGMERAIRVQEAMKKTAREIQAEKEQQGR